MLFSVAVCHFSRPFIEAHLHKKAAIGSNVQGMDEIIKHGKTGLIVPKNNPKALAEAINLISKDSYKAKKLGENGYKQALKKFTSENIIRFEKIYDSLLKQ